MEPNPGDTWPFTETIETAKLTNEVYCVSDGDSALDDDPALREIPVVVLTSSAVEEFWLAIVQRAPAGD